MLDELLTVLTQRQSSGTPAIRKFDRNQLAAAAVLVETSRADASVTDDERRTVHRMVEMRFGLSTRDTERLVQVAAQGEYYWLFTDAVKKALVPNEIVDIIESMWEVAYADGELHRLEADLAHRIAKMFAVSEVERDEARARVCKRLGVNA